MFTNLINLKLLSPAASNYHAVSVHWTHACSVKLGKMLYKHIIGA